MITKALILKKQNTNEYDQLVTCYTQDFGKLTAIAKSILKPSSIQAMHLDIFNLVEFELVSGRGLPIITGAQLTDSRKDLKNSVASSAIANFFCEVLDKMVPDSEPDPGLWNFMLKLLSRLDKFEPSLAMFRQQQFEMLKILGYSPETVKLAAAGNPNLSSRTALDDSFEYNLGFRLKSLNFLYSVLK